jgi:hypothetical protein
MSKQCCEEILPSALQAYNQSMHYRDKLINGQLQSIAEQIKDAINEGMTQVCLIQDKLYADVLFKLQENNYTVDLKVRDNAIIVRWDTTLDKYGINII